MIFTGSCSKDLGNYDYQPINELNITSIQSNYVVRTGIDTLRITPNITASMDDADTSKYNYFWIIRIGSNVLDTIGRSRNLEYAVRLNPVQYPLYYRVTEKKTGITAIANTTLTVNTAFSRGLLLMGENDQGFAEAEMLTMIRDTVLVKNILSTSGLPPLKDPISLVHTGGTEAYIKLWAFTKSGSYYLDRATLTGTVNNNFNRLLYVSESLDPATLHPVALAPQIRTAAGAIGSTLYRAMITVGGDVFASFPIVLGGDFFNNPINRVATNQAERLPAAPYALHAINNMSSLVWYDTRYNRFLNYSSFTALASSTISDAPTDAFPWNQPAGRTLVYAENTRNTDGGSTNGNSFSIMKDANGAHHIYKFYASGATPAKRAYYAVKPIATDFDKANFYAFSSNRTVVFYAVGNKLYAYDYNVNNERSYQFPELGADEISMLKFDTQIDQPTNSLYIATYNSATKGKLQRFRVGTNPNVVELLPQPNSTWSNLIKVKDVNWRAVN